MALKLPVVASPVGVNKEIIIDGVNGMLAYSEDEWYSKIIELKNDHHLCKLISNKGYQTVKKKFSLNNYKLLYLQIIKNIINTN